jgi:hypothetical protein
MQLAKLKNPLTKTTVAQGRGDYRKRTLSSREKQVTRFHGTSGGAKSFS